MTKLPTKQIKICRAYKNETYNDVIDQIIVEESLEIKINNDTTFALWCTPTNLKELVIGHLFTNNIISEITEITDLKISDLTAEVATCKKKTFAPAPTLDFTIKLQTLFEVMAALQKEQKLFKLVGSTHAAGIFNQDGTIIFSAEDIARHNALDKVIGWCLINSKNMRDYGIALSSRVSAELIKKIITACFPLVVAVSAPSSFAVEMANLYNVTLCGFARNEKINIYTHQQKIKETNL